MISRLYGYFGSVGCASIGAWVAALAVLFIFIRSRHRVRLYLVALGLAVLGVILAQINSQRVSTIHLEAVAPVPQPSSEEITTEAGVPAYLQMGKQHRAADQSTPVEPAEQKSPERVLKEAQLLEANRLDRWNLIFTHGTLLLVLLALVTDYLARFNRTTEYSYPLPIAGRWLDRVFPKKRAVLARALDVTAYLETVVRRGETFLYFTAADPWNTGTVRSLPKIVYGDPADVEFYFDAVWFKRYCVVVLAPDATTLLSRLEPYLEWRTFTKAVTRQTVNVVWDLPAPPADALLEELIPLFREANFKLVVKSPNAKREIFEEIDV